MVTLNTAEMAMKNVYLSVLPEQIKIAANPFYSKIKQTSNDIFGKEVVKLAPFGVNGGFATSGETDPLPVSGHKNYAQIRSTLKNLYGTFQISDKAVRSSSNNIGNFVNLLSDEMEALVKSCVFNLNRMLYGDGSGTLATIVSSNQLLVKVDTTAGLMEGMYVDYYNTAGVKQNTEPYLITRVNRVDKNFKYDKGNNTSFINGTGYITVQNSKDNELSGLDRIFSYEDTLYGISRSANHWAQPWEVSREGKEVSDMVIQEVLDYLEDYADSKVNFITTSASMRRAYQQFLNVYRKNVDVVELENGYKTITHNGIPIYADKFVKEGSIYLLNTDDFVLHQLGDWQWMEDEAGHVLRQNPGFPTYTGTLTKYAELICNKPMGQGKIIDLLTTIDDPYKTYIPPETTPSV